MSAHEKRTGTGNTVCSFSKGLIFISNSTSPPSSDASDRSKQCLYSDEFRRDFARLITGAGYLIPAAAKARRVSDQTVLNWYGPFAPAPEVTGDESTVEELRSEVKRLRKQLRRTELERTILENVTPRRIRFDCPFGAFATKLITDWRWPFLYAAVLSPSVSKQARQKFAPACRGPF